MKAHVLVVDGRIPRPDRDGGSLRLFNILTLLVELAGQVTFVPGNPEAEPEDAPDVKPYVAALRAAGVEVFSAPRIQSLRQHLEQMGRRYDVVLLSGGVYHAFEPMPLVRRYAPQTSLWFDSVDLAHVREYRRARVTGAGQFLKYALQLKDRELRAAAEADWTLVVSQEEAAVLHSVAPLARVRVLSNVHQVHGRAAQFDARRGIVFIGAYRHAPNLDGIQWFLQSVFPAVRQALPGVQLSLIGADPPPEALALAAPDVHIAGHVANLGDYYNACRLSIAPLRYGAGVKGKVLLSLGYGVPVVCTPLAAEGSHLVDGENARIAESPDAFARAVVEVYSRPDAWRRLSDNGLETVQRHFSFAAARRQLGQLLTDSLVSRQPAERAAEVL